MFHGYTAAHLLHSSLWKRFQEQYVSNGYSLMQFIGFYSIYNCYTRGDYYKHETFPNFSRKRTRDRADIRGLDNYPKNLVSNQFWTSGGRSGSTPAILPAQIIDHIPRLMNITTEDR